MKKAKLKKELAMEQETTDALRKELSKVRNDLQRVNQERARLESANRKLKDEEVKVELTVDTEFEELELANPGYAVKTFPAQHTVNLIMTYKKWQYRFIGYKFDGKEMVG